MDAIESANRWHQWAVKGTDEVLARVIENLDATSSPGWKRLRGDELKPFQSLVRPESAWYKLDATDSYVGVTLSVERIKNTELRGGRVMIGSPTYPSAVSNIPAVWNLIMKFLDDGIVAAARTAGAEVKLPTREEMFIFELPPDVAERLRKFSRAARKSLPLNREEAALWRQFIISAFRAKAVIIDAELLPDWLTRDGWNREAALQLTLRFFDQIMLLSTYADEVSVA